MRCAEKKKGKWSARRSDKNLRFMDGWWKGLNENDVPVVEMEVFLENCAAASRAYAFGITHCCPICSYFIWWMFVQELITFPIHFSSDSSSDCENKLAELAINEFLRVAGVNSQFLMTGRLVCRIRSTYDSCLLSEVCVWSTTTSRISVFTSFH